MRPSSPSSTPRARPWAPSTRPSNAFSSIASPTSRSSPSLPPSPQWQTTLTHLRELESSEADRLRLSDLWRFQSSEIRDASLTSDDEDSRLEAEKRILANAEKLFHAASSAHDLLYESEGSAESTLGAALKHLEELARYDPRFLDPAQQLASAKSIVEDIDANVRDFAQTVQASPERLAEIEDRLAALERLKRKYGPTLAHVIAFGAETSAKLDEVGNRDQHLADLRRQLALDATAYELAAADLHRQRTSSAALLEKQAEAEINDLAMHSSFSIRVTAHPETHLWSAHGSDTIEFLIATNPGEPLKPLTEIASGGEISRVLLALKVTVEDGVRSTPTPARGLTKSRRTARSVVSPASTPRTLVFDEIDIGIGGRAAEAVGRKLKTLSQSQQVLCITHLPQIAAFGDQHFLISKSERRGRTETAVHRMERSERVQEIARMLSGASLTETSLRHAEHLLAASL